MGKGVLSAVVGAALCAVVTVAAAASDVVGVVTEIRKAQGDVRAKIGEGDWKPVRPLMSLRAGDQVRVEGDARAVILITGGGAKTVTAKDSPFVVATPTADVGAGSTRAIVTNVARFLAHKQDEPTYLKLTSRGVPPGPNIPVILSPRQTLLLRTPVTFVWSGSDALRYTIEVSGPGGRLWSESGLPREPVAYPASAPPLEPGVRYQWALGASGYPTLKTWFEIATESQISRVRSELAQLDPNQLKNYPPSTVTVLRAGLLFTDKFYKDALDELQGNPQAYNEEPTLRFMAGHVYDQIGLKYMAKEYFEQAARLSASK